MTRIEEIIVKHTRLAKEASDCMYEACIAETEEEAIQYRKRVEECKKEIEELRVERKKLIGK